MNMAKSTVKTMAIGIMVASVSSPSMASANGSMELLHSVQQQQREASAGSNDFPRGKQTTNYSYLS